MFDRKHDLGYATIPAEPIVERHRKEEHFQSCFYSKARDASGIYAERFSLLKDDRREETYHG